jgi:hypothetical protein
LATLVMVQAGWLVAKIPMPWETGAVAMGMREKVLTAVVKLPALVAVCGGVYVGLTRFLGMAEVFDLPVVGRILRRREKA